MKGTRFRGPRTRVLGIITALAAGLVLTVIVVVFGGSSPKTSVHHTAPMRTIAPAAPAPVVSASPQATGPAMPNPDVHAIDRTVEDFVAAAFDYKYTDGPNTTAQRCAPYLAPGFQGTLPQAPSPDSNAGQTLVYARANSTAYLTSASAIRFNWTQDTSAQITVAFTVATVYPGAESPPSENYTRVITLAKTSQGWKVSALSDGADGP